MFRIVNDRILMPAHPKLRTVFSHADVIQHKGHDFIAIPHGLEETRFLRNLKLNVPGPIRTGYDWCGTTPFASQVDTAEMLTLNKRAYVLSELGTGKTRSALFAADYLMRTGAAKRALIIAPLSTLTAVWDREIFSVMSHRRAAVLHGSRDERLTRLRERVDFYILNTDGVTINAVHNALKCRPDIDIVIIDELAMFRNAQSKRWKALQKIVADRPYVWGMTGSPTPQAPTDAFAQVKLITPDTLPVPYFGHFRSMTMHQVTTFRWVAKREANDIVRKAMRPAVRFTRADCADLPPVHYVDREVEMSPAQKRAYAQMKNDFVAQFTDTSLTAVNAGVQMGKLLQICAGFGYDANGKPHFIDADNRIEALREIIRESERKVIVYASFKAMVDMLEEAISKDKENPVTVAKVYGDTPKAERDKIFYLFQNAADPKVLVAHPQSVSHGLTLTAANIIVWYTPITSNEIYEQACGRITRHGQTASQLIYHLIAGPVEKRVFTALRLRKNMQAELLDLYKGIVET